MSHLGTTGADFVRLRRSASPVFRLHRLRDDPGTGDRLLSVASDRIESPLAALTGRVRGRLVRGFGCVARVVGRSMPASSAQSCAAWPSARNWSVCSSRRLWLVSCSTVSPSCWTLMVSPRAHRFHSSRASTCRRRTGDLVDSVAEPNPAVVAIERRLCLLDACSCLVVLVDVRAGAVPGVLEVFDGALGGALRRREFPGERPVAAQPVVSRRRWASVCCHRA